MLKRICGLFLLSFLFTSCLTYKDVEVGGIQDVKMKNFSLKGLEMEVTMKVNNPNNYKISIVDSDLDIIIKGKELGKANIKENIVLNKRSNENHTFTIKSTFKNVSSLLMLMGSKSLNLQIKGSIKARSKFVSKRVPIDITENISL